MLRVIHVFGQPISFPIDPTAEFQAGMIAQLKNIGNDIVAGVSDGSAPLGLIDDTRSSSFSRNQVDEVVEITDVQSVINGNGERVSTYETHGTLENPSIYSNSFTSTITVELVDVNGIIYVPAGTPLNYDYDNDGVYDGFRIVCNYTYKVSNKPGDDTTLPSGRITVHYCPGVYETDQFDSRAVYPLNATLFVGLDGKLTTKRATEDHPGVAFVTGPPVSTNGTIQFMWL